MPQYKSYDDLRLAIVAQHDRLPNRLRQIAEFAVAHPEEMALETVAKISSRAKVQPSSLVRFAKQFGFSGFSDMQQVFRSRLVDRAGSYGKRIRETHSARHGDSSPLVILSQLAEAVGASLQQMRHDTRASDVEKAVNILIEANIIGLVAQRRSFPVAAYLGYALSQLERPTVLIDGVGGLAAEQSRLLGESSALIAVSFAPYAPETLSIVDQARMQGARVVAITDNVLSPLASAADVHFEVNEAQVWGIRSLAVANCMAVLLVVALGQRLENSLDQARQATRQPSRLTRQRRSK